jgi:hypothetical protein
MSDEMMFENDSDYYAEGIVATVIKIKIPHQSTRRINVCLPLPPRETTFEECQVIILVDLIFADTLSIKDTE